MRVFDSGATRNIDTRKVDYEGFYSPLVMARFARYMHKNRRMKDGARRASDNWQKGIPLDAYMKSAFRHFVEWWTVHRGWKRVPGRAREDMICALLFNAQGYLHECLELRLEASALARAKGGRRRK